MEQETRLDYIDIFKGFGIILMIMGHIGFGSLFAFFIHAFHMPIFFFISGFLFRCGSEKTRKEIETPEYIKRKCRTLLIPYCFFGVFHYVFLTCWEGFHVDFRILTHLFFINTSGMPIAGALWFLTALFFTSVIYFCLDRYIENYMLRTVIIIMLALMGNYAVRILPFRLPYALDASFVGLGLFHMAHILKQNQNKKYLKSIFSLKFIEWFIFTIIIGILIFKNGYINMRLGEYAKVPLFWINAVGAGIIGMNFSKYCCPLKDRLRIFSFIFKFIGYIGKNSIVYVCLNEFVIYIFRNHIELLELPDGVASLVFLIVTIVILYFLDTVINTTVLRVIIGRSLKDKPAKLQA